MHKRSSKALALRRVRNCLRIISKVRLALDGKHKSRDVWKLEVEKPTVHEAVPERAHGGGGRVLRSSVLSTDVDFPRMVKVQSRRPYSDDPVVQQQFLKLAVWIGVRHYLAADPEASFTAASKALPDVECITSTRLDLDELGLGSYPEEVLKVLWPEHVAKRKKAEQERYSARVPTNHGRGGRGRGSRGVSVPGPSRAVPREPEGSRRGGKPAEKAQPKPASSENPVTMTKKERREWAAINGCSCPHSCGHVGVPRGPNESFCKRTAHNPLGKSKKTSRLCDCCAGTATPQVCETSRKPPWATR